MTAIVKEFVVESRENLDQLERDLIDLESHPTSRETLGSIFRTVHTIKGAAGFMGLPKLEALAHSGESVLSSLRDGTLAINPAITSALLGLSDTIRVMLVQVDSTGSEGETDCTALVDQLTGLLGGGAPCAAGVETAGEGPSGAGEDNRQQAGLAPISHVRVNVDQLDTLMNLVGELVLARNEIMQASAVQKHSVLLGTSQRLNSITTQLQEGIMKTRMQPIDNVWSKLPRVVRDSAQYCGKRARLEMEGKETELDRTLIEAIQDPLTHVVRNCIDHGLEAPQKRIAAGKPAEGRVTLRAFHEGGQVTIEVSDDGAGIDVAAIKRKALACGLITPEQARVLSEQDAINLIFLPGLSTAASVTTLSGRGVGMDVVKTNIERIGGRVTVHSVAGLGTTFRMRIPLTLAIMTALVVTSGAECYALPQVNVLELVRLAGDDARSRIELIRDAAVYRLRGELLPLVWLSAQLTPDRETRSDRRSSDCDLVNIVVLEADTFKFGLVVDEVNDMQEIVVKPLGRHVRGIPMFAGATITGDGRVVLILDVPALALQAQVLSDVVDWAGVRSDAVPEREVEDKVALVLFTGPDGAQMAVPLSQITRLEEFPTASIELVGGQPVVQYFGDILPLTSIASLLSGPARRTDALLAANDASVQALVHAKDGRQVGIVIDRILDTIEQSLAGLRPATRTGVAGSVVIQGRVTEILDFDVIAAGPRVGMRPPHALAGAEVCQ